jgi:methyltransferase (TIGR00027 family)
MAVNEPDRTFEARPRIADRHSDTAEAVAAMRAGESRLPAGRRLVNDPMAGDLVRRPAYRLVASSAWVFRLVMRWLEWRCPGVQGQVMYRGRYSDDAIAEAAGLGVGQVVLLGAGFDSTAFRLDVAATFFDVDVPTTQGVKRERLAAAKRIPKSPTVYVPCHFGVDDLGVRLRDGGFDPTAPALFVWLGVTPYLSIEAFRAALDDIRGLSVPGGRLVLDYAESAVLDGTRQHRGARQVQKMLARRGEPLRLGFTPTTVRETLGEYGFVVDEDLGLLDLAARYPVTGRARYATDGWNRIVSATFAGVRPGEAV